MNFYAAHACAMLVDDHLVWGFPCSQCKIHAHAHDARTMLISITDWCGLAQARPNNLVHIDYAYVYANNFLH